MNLRGKNFISQIFHISVVESTIKSLFGGDRYYFNLNIKGESRVYYIVVEDVADGEVFKLYRDFTKYADNSTEGIFPTNKPAGDELIKIIHSSNGPVIIGTTTNMDSEGNMVELPIYADPKMVTHSTTPAEAMAKYTLVYIDALQTV